MSHDPWGSGPSRTEPTEESLPEESEPAASSAQRGSAQQRTSRRRLRLGAVVAVAVAAAFAVWLVVRNNSESNPSTSTTKKTVALISAQGLRSVAASIKAPIYWAGAEKGTRYELTQTSDGRYFVRYLPAGIAAGSSTPYPFVASFPVADAYAKTARVAARSSSVRLSVTNGVAFYSKSSPTNIYVAFQGTDTQIEVFAPNPEHARQLVEQGRIELVSQTGTSTSSAPAIASLAQLKAIPKAVHHDVYWAGPEAGKSYELTQTQSGKIFIRYLPPAVKAGSTDPYLFVATFPLPGAYTATKSVAANPESVTIPIRGGVAFYSTTSPSNVYIAFPNVDFQIEVFDPNPARAHAVVHANRIQPIG